MALLIMRGSGMRPFGSRSNLLVDNGAQFLQFYTVFRDILTGSDLSSFQYTWTLGAGVPFLPVYATYLGGPFTFLVALFPANRVPTAINAIVVAKLVTASAVMFALLRALGPRRHPLVAGVLAIAYATSAWIFDVGWYYHQWLDGVIAFPALCLVALRCRSRRRALWPGVLVVALFWWSNFYSAYMASLGAVIVLVAVEAATSRGLRRSLARIGRFALTGVLGVALTAPILVPTLVSLRDGTPAPGTDLTTITWKGILVRLLPMTEGVYSSPSLFCSSAALLLVLGIPAALHLPGRMRLVIALSGAAVLASLKVPGLLLAWNAFQVPHGQPFRCGFVIIGLILATAHTAWPPRRTHPGNLPGRSLGAALRRPRDWPGPTAWACSAVLFAGVARTARIPRDAHLFVSPDAALTGWILLAIGAAASIICTAAAVRGGSAWRHTLSAVLVLATAGGIALSAQESLKTTAFTTDHLRVWAREVSPKASEDAARQRAADAATRRAAWPVHRVNADLVSGDPIWSKYNSSARYPFPGIDYYSTTVEATTSHALVDLGYADASGGRILYRPADEVLSSLLAADDPRSRFNPVPMVRMVPQIAPGTGLPTDMAARERLLGARIYSTPAIYHSDAAGVAPITRPAVVPAGISFDVRITCPAGHYVVTHQYFYGTARLVHGNGGSVRVGESAEADNQDMVGSHFLVERSDGTPTAVRFRADETAARDQRTIHPDGLGCLDPQPLQHRIITSGAPSSLDITPSHIQADFSRPQAGRIVVATTASNGWLCRVDGQPTTIEPLAGMLSVKASGAHKLSCGYRPPGLTSGIAVAALALLATAAISAVSWRRSRAVRRGRP